MKVNIGWCSVTSKRALMSSLCKLTDGESPNLPPVGKETVVTQVLFRFITFMLLEKRFPIMIITKGLDFTVYQQINIRKTYAS